MSTSTTTPQEPGTESPLEEPSFTRSPGIEPSTVHPVGRGPGLAVLAVSALIGVLFWYLMPEDFDGGLGIILAGAGAFVLYAAGVYVVYRNLGGQRVAQDQFVRALVYGAFLLALLPLCSLLWTVTSNGLVRAFDPAFLTQSMNGVTGLNDANYVEGTGSFVGGAYHAIIGTLIITGIATVISVPIGMLTAIYLVEYGGKNRLAMAVRFLVDVMTGIPSIVAGLFAFALFTQILGPGNAKIGFAGSIALCVLMIPTVVRNSEEMLRIVPNELREAALALGVPKWRVIAKVVLPTAISGLASGVTLAIARVIGETAPLLVAVGTFYAINMNPFNGPMNTLAVYAYSMFKRPLNPGYADPSYERAWAAALLLMIIVVVLNLLARLIAKLFAPKTSGR